MKTRKEYKSIAGGKDVKPMPSTLAKDWLANHDALYVEEWKCFVVRDGGRNHYRVVRDVQLSRVISRWADRKFPSLRVTKSYCADAVWSAASLTHPSHVISPPTKHAAFDDCLLDLYAMEPVPSESAPTVIGFGFPFSEVMAAEGKMWHEYLRSTFVFEDGVTHDPALARSFQETAGTLLLASRAVSCAVFLYGPTAGNGKSTMLDVLRGILPRELTSALSIPSLVDNRFASSHLLGKKFNFCGEIGTKYAKSDLFKSIVTGDLIPAEYKHGENFEYVPEAAMWFAVNSIPTWEGIDDGLMRRMRMYPFRADFKGKGRRIDGLASKIVEREPKAVLRWMIEGARRLRDNGYAFSEEADEAIRPSMESLERESSAVLRFVADRGYRHSPVASVPTADVFRDYLDWCDEVRCKTMNENNFRNDFRRVTRCGAPFDDRHRVVEGGKVSDKVLKSFAVTKVSPAVAPSPQQPFLTTPDGTPIDF